MNNPNPFEPSGNLSRPSMSGDATPLLDRASARVSTLAQRGVDAVRDSSQQLRDVAWRASDNTTRLVRDEPIKAILIAAAAGAAMMALVGLLTRSRAAR